MMNNFIEKQHFVKKPSSHLLWLFRFLVFMVLFSFHTIIWLILVRYVCETLVNRGRKIE
jgi:hypothetical protein